MFRKRYNKRGKATLPYKRRSYVRNKAQKPSKRFTKLVQKVIHKDSETKEASTSYALTAFNSGVNSVGDMVRVLPQVQQGNTNGARIGDTILAQRLSIKGHMLINVIPTLGGSGVVPTAIPPNARIMIRAFIFSVKKFGNYDDASAYQGSFSSQFLKNGTYTQALDGTIQSMYLPVNTDIITVHKEIKRVVTIDALATYSAGTPTNLVAMSNVNFSNSVKFFSANVRCKKTLKYDSSSYSPQNFAPMFCLSYCHLDGSSPDVVTTVVSAALTSTLFYEDA